MSIEDEIVFTPALSTPNQYFIFRDSGEQVTIKIVNGKWHPDMQLSMEEKRFINNNLFKND